MTPQGALLWRLVDETGNDVSVHDVNVVCPLFPFSDTRYAFCIQARTGSVLRALTPTGSNNIEIVFCLVAGAAIRY